MYLATDCIKWKGKTFRDHMKDSISWLFGWDKGKCQNRKI